MQTFLALKIPSYLIFIERIFCQRVIRRQHSVWSHTSLLIQEIKGVFFVCWCAFSGLTFRVYLFRLWNSCHDNHNCLRYWQRGSGTLESFPESSQWRPNEGLTHFHGLEERKARGEIYDRWNYWWCRLRAKTTKQIKGEWLVIKKTQRAKGKTPIVNFVLTPPLHRMCLTSQAASAKRGKNLA